MTARPTKNKKARRRGQWSVDDLPTPSVDPANRPADWQSRSIGLVEVYNRCVSRVNTGRERQSGWRSPNRATLEVMWALHVWCEQIKVDPSSWIYAVHAAMSWKIPAGQQALFSAGYRKTYETMHGGEFSHVTGMAARKAPKFRPFIELGIGAERAKARYRDRQTPELCIIAPDITFGYHHKSESCAVCTLAADCQSRTSSLARENYHP